MCAYVFALYVKDGRVRTDVQCSILRHNTTTATTTQVYSSRTKVDHVYEQGDIFPLAQETMCTYTYL